MSSEQCNKFIYNRCHYGVYKLVLCMRQTPAPTTLLLYSKLKEILTSSSTNVQIVYKFTSLVPNVLLFPVALRPNAGQGLLILEVS